ncbi:MAG: sulfite reductase subunit alpha [Gammaproteobacteria bacterium]
MRFLLAAAIVAAYIVFTATVLRAHRRKAASARRAADATLGTASHGALHATAPGASNRSQTPPLLVAYASQTGYAEQIANQTAQSLQAANIPSRVRALSELSLDELAATERALFVVSTYGEGDPPDAGLHFVNSVMSGSPTLSQLGYGVLALGDRTYRNFCGFGKTLDGWLRSQCAVPLFDLVEVDNADEGALLHWQRHLGALSGKTDAPVWTPPRYEPWRIASRRLLNPGSAGQPCFHIELTPPPGVKLSWKAGDVAVLTPPGTNAREYSIASMPSEGALCILVRQSRRADGTLGVASGWLTEHAALGTEVPLRIRANSNFHGPDDAAPIILIGNGTGIAGLRSHLKAREGVPGARNWLIFGERNAAHDTFYREDLERWRASGVLTRVDLAFSRDQDERTYVQHIIQRSEKEIREWVAQGATIYVCGSAAGMATAVDEALAGALGRDLLNELLAGRRYRRDVY